MIHRLLRAERAEKHPRDLPWGDRSGVHVLDRLLGSAPASGGPCVRGVRPWRPRGLLRVVPVRMWQWLTHAPPPPPV